MEKKCFKSPAEARHQADLPSDRLFQTRGVAADFELCVCANGVKLFALYEGIVFTVNYFLAFIAMRCNLKAARRCSSRSVV